MINLADIKDITKVEINIPEWNTSCYLSELTAGDLDAYTQEVIEKADNIRSRLLVKVLVDENGKKLFNNGDVPMLASKSGRVINRLYLEALKINNLNIDDAIENEKKD